MRGIPNDGLIEIANLKLDIAAGVSDRAKIAHVAIPTNPNLRPLWKRAASHSIEPLIVANGIAPYVGVRRSGHFALTDILEAKRASAGSSNTLLVFHGCKT